MIVTEIKSNGSGGCLITLMKPCEDQQSQGELESTFVNLYTESNITFAKGYILRKTNDFKPIEELNLPPSERSSKSKESVKELSVEEIDERLNNFQNYFKMVV